jgi:cell division protease FtsH
MSDETAKLIDQEIRQLIDNAESHARKILRKNIKHLHNLAKALLDYETLSGDDVKQLISKGKLKSTKGSDKSAPNRKTSIPLGAKGDSKKRRNLDLDPNPAAT